MSDIQLPFLEASILVALLGAVWVSRLRDAKLARRLSLVLTSIVMACVGAAWYDYSKTGDGHTLLAKYFGSDVLLVEELNAPLLLLAALLFLLTALATSRIRVRRFSFTWMLASEAILLATLGCKEPWGLVALLSIGTLPPYFELRARNRPRRVFALHMGLYVVLLVVGWSLVEMEGVRSQHSWPALLPLLFAIFIRSGLFPFHCWMTDLFEHATFGSAILFVAPMAGAYAAVRLVLPIAPDWALHGIGLVSLFTALYCAGMALVQREGRRFFCFVFLSHSALVLVGMDTIASASEKDGVIGLTGGLCVWLSVGLALAGFGLTLRALESRHGRLSLTRYHGLYDYTPTLAVGFLLTGLASLGFPGTFGFFGTELLVEGAVASYAFNVGLVVGLVAALNGLAVVRAYFLLFTGTKHVSSVPLVIGRRERVTVLVLALLILLGGLFPQSAVDSRYKAAVEIRDKRRSLFGAEAERESVPRLAHKDDVVAD